MYSKIYLNHKHVTEIHVLFAIYYIGCLFERLIVIICYIYFYCPSRCYTVSWNLVVIVFKININEYFVNEKTVDFEVLTKHSLIIYLFSIVVIFFNHYSYHCNAQYSKVEAHFYILINSRLVYTLWHKSNRKIVKWPFTGIVEWEKNIERILVFLGG